MNQETTSQQIALVLTIVAITALIILIGRWIG